MQKVEEKMIRGSRIAIVLYDMTNGLSIMIYERMTGMCVN